MGRPKILILSRGATFTSSELATSAAFKAALQAKMNLARSASGKCFIVDGNREADNKTGEPATGNLGDGYIEVLNDALPTYDFKNTKGVAEQQSLVSFNGFTDTVYIIDHNGILWHRGGASGSGKGFTIGNFYATAPAFGGTGNINTNLVKLTFGDADEFKTNVGALKLDFTAAELNQLTDVLLSEAASASGYAFKIAVKQRFAGNSVYAEYEAGLNQTGAWKATLADGTDVVIASVAGNDAGEYWLVTLASSPTIAAEALITIELKDPATLAALTTPVLG
ncbi:MAG: hypothetical protein EOP83_23595, partial [Verrucomicrobiaceae bacterium]